MYSLAMGCGGLASLPRTGGRTVPSFRERTLTAEERLVKFNIVPVAQKPWGP